MEGMNNACKHSHATNFWVTLDYSIPDSTSLTIRDDGIGADDIREGFGLIGLKERILLLNGTVNIQTEKGCGMTLEITVAE
jgi:signal transduction histidine kinase